MSRKDREKYAKKQANKMVCEMWDSYVEHGSLEKLEEEFGQFASQREKDIFQSGWKVGADFILGYSFFLSEKLEEEAGGQIELVVKHPQNGEER